MTAIKGIMDFIKTGMEQADSCEEHDIYELIYNKVKELYKKDLEEHPEWKDYQDCDFWELGYELYGDLEDVTKSGSFSDRKSEAVRGK